MNFHNFLERGLSLICRRNIYHVTGDRQNLVRDEDRRRESVYHVTGNSRNLIGDEDDRRIEAEAVPVPEDRERGAEVVPLREKATSMSDPEEKKEVVLHMLAAFHRNSHLII